MTKQKWGWFKKNNINDIIRHFEWFNMRDMFNFRVFDMVGPKMFKLYLIMRFFVTRKPSISKLDIMNTTRCTLNCRDCCAFIPHYRPENHVKPMGFENFKMNLDGLLASVDLIYILQFVGGEPLLDKELDKELEYAVSKHQIRHIFITTNSTIMPSPLLIKSLKNKKCAVQLSNYSMIKTSVPLFYNQWLTLLKNNEIRYITYNEFYFYTVWSIRDCNVNHDTPPPP
ncbi:MAG: radical SAM protein, partial [Spirochaetaceae bacterium]|nr:radical SAM protein [Spirochaetaceae bacterium]